MTKKQRNDELAAQRPEQHAELQGERTHARFQEQLHESPSSGGDNVIETHRDEKHRLAAGDREQHDEAEKNSERNRQRR